MEDGKGTGFVWLEIFAWHFNGNCVTGSEPSGIREAQGIYLQPTQHFENAETKRRIYNLVSVCGLLDHLHPIKPEIATKEDLLRFHTEPYVEKIREMSQQNGGDAGEVALFGVGSFEVACWSAGGCITAVKQVWNGKLKNAYALVRPPGHHAERDIGKGFCLFNNIALAAKYAQQVLGVKRIAIIDWDVHHGNGTQQAFYDDDSVLFVSVHQDNLYPFNSGSLSQIGEGKGEGFNINIPLPPGTGIGGYSAVFERVIFPAVEAFQPQIILVSCGFDASALDPLAHMMLSSKFFGEITKKLMQVADRVCGGKIVMCHEGGYSLEMVPFCGLRVIEALSGHDTKVVNPFDPEIEAYAYHELQQHQDNVIKKAEELVKKYIVK